MKLKNILRNVTAMALPLALLGSCTGDFEELNTNPYEIDPEELPFEAQFSTPLSFSYPTHQNLFQYWTSLSIDNYGGYFEVPHSNWTMARYDLARGFCGGMHENFMQKIFNNTRRLIKQCDAAGQHDFAAVARIVERITCSSIPTPTARFPIRRSSQRTNWPNAPAATPTTNRKISTRRYSHSWTKRSKDWIRRPQVSHRSTAGATATARSGRRSPTSSSCAWRCASSR